MLADGPWWWRAFAVCNAGIVKKQLFVAKYGSHLGSTSWSLAEKQLRRPVSSCNIKQYS